MIINKIKQLFCNHYYRYNYPTTIRSLQKGDDNYIIDQTDMVCKYCKKRMTIEVVDKIEKNFYK